MDSLTATPATMHPKLSLLLLLFVFFKTVVEAENEEIEESMRSAMPWSDSQLKIAYGIHSLQHFL